MTAQLLTFTPPVYTDARTLVAPDGRKWCARAYLDRHCPNQPTHGKTYTPAELVRLYGMLTRDGRPGLFLYDGEKMPETVTYLVEPLDVGDA